ncbi:MAG: DUF2070 family protein [Candidatus Methanomethyliaceae archaeon]|nr:DUF2070 family protein [Candidatus Methanomethyliaceae archaeon]MDW7971469.1 DUF2070 family protein [Nitrososphaerota archaeon]
MSFTDKLIEKYKYTFSLPKSSLIIFTIFISGLFFGIFIYGIFPYGIDPLSYVLKIIIIFTTSPIIGAYIIDTIMNDAFLNRRRLMGLLLFGMLIFGIIEIIGALLSRIFNNYLILEKTYAITAGALTALYAIVIGSITNINTKKLLILSIIHPLIIISFLSFFMMFSNLSYNLLIFLLMSGISFFITKQYLMYIERVGREILGYGSIALLKAFIEAMMIDRTGLLEKVLKMIATVDNAIIRILDFKGNNILGRMVAPEIHSGPFKNVGSSSLPTILAERFRERGINPLIFHVPSNHERDLILSKECEMVVKTILSLEIKEGKALATKSVNVKRGRITVTCQAFNGTPLIVISRAPIPTEDLPSEINELCLKKLLEKGFSDGIIVDAHNAMDGNHFEFGENDKADLLEALNFCLDELKKDSGARPLIGFANSKLEGYTVKQGFGDGGIMVMVVEVNGQKTAYIVFDGNNMISGLREKIINAVKREGFEVSEVATTDTHVVVGWRAKEGYTPIGKNVDSETIVNKTIELIKEADSKKEECSINFSKITLEKLHFLGYEGMERLWFVTDVSIKRAKRGGCIASILITILGLIIGLIF